MARNGRCHETDGAGAGNEDIFTEDRKGKRRVDGVAKRIKDARDVEINARAMVPDIAHRQGEVFGESSRSVYPDSASVGAEMAATR